MKKLQLLFIALLGFVIANAQNVPILDSSDLVFAGEYLPYVKCNTTTGVDFGTTGQNVFWDYSQLTRSSQFTDSFTTLFGSPTTYAFAFFTNSNLAAPEKNNLSVAGFALSNVWNYYRKTSTKFTQAGFAGNIQGIPFPLRYSSADLLYKLPCTLGNTDSSNYKYTLTIPVVGFTIKEQRIRHNIVDGYGTLITPSDTFYNVNRIHSRLDILDSVALDTLGLNISNIASIRHEYKFLAKGYDWPVVEIITNEIAGNQTISSIVYRDSLHPYVAPILNSVATLSEGNSSTKIYPNPSSNYIMIELPEGADEYRISNSMGQTVVQRNIKIGGQVLEEVRNYPAGIYFLEIKNKKGAPLRSTFQKL